MSRPGDVRLCHRARRVRGRGGARVLAAAALAGLGCYGGLGPDTPTARFDLTGTIRSAADGSPLPGVEVFLACTGCGDDPPPLCLIGGSGTPPKLDTVATDPQGRFRLATRYYCPAGLRASREGFATHRWPSLPCSGGIVTSVFDASLQPSPPTVRPAEP